MKDSGIEWIGEIPEDWEVVYLSSIFDEHKRKNTGLICKNLLSLSYGKIKRKDINTTDGLLPESFEGYNIIEKGDIVLRLTDLQNDQRSLRTGIAQETGLITSAYTTIRCLPRIASSEYMHYYLHSFDTSKGFYGMGDGVRQGLNFDGIKKIFMLLPHIAEQQRIADYLDKKCAAVDRLMENQRLQIEKLKEYKQSLITEAVTKGLDKTVPLKSSGVEWIGDIPEGWKVCRIKDLFELRNERNYEELSKVNLISLYTELGVMQHSDIEETTGNKAVKAEGYKLVYKDDIVVNIILCWMGAVGKSNYNGVTSPAYDVYKPNLKASSDYYHYLFRTTQFNGECYRYGRGIMMMRWRTYSSEFRAISVPCPSLSEQQQIAEYLDKKCAEIDELISIKQQKIEKLTEYKKSLIYEYVTGKKQVG